MLTLNDAEFSAVLDQTAWALGEGSFYGRSVSLKHRSETICRCGGRPILDLSLVPSFIVDVNRWLPNRHPRLLYICHFEEGFPSPIDALRTLHGDSGRAADGDPPRGYLFPMLDYDLADQAAIETELYRETSLLVGLVGLILLGGWDAILFCPDREEWIEFWEGNILFYSVSDGRLQQAELLLQNYGCPARLK